MSHRLKSLLVLILLIPLGLGTKSYRGFLGHFIRASGGGFFYTVFLFFCLRLLFPRQSRRNAALSATLASIAVECLQLWQPPFLQAIRQTTGGALLLGSSFSWVDWPPYLLGGIAAFFVAKSLKL